MPGSSRANLLIQKNWKNYIYYHFITSFTQKYLSFIVKECLFVYILFLCLWIYRYSMHLEARVTIFNNKKLFNVFQYVHFFHPSQAHSKFECKNYTQKSTLMWSKNSHSWVWKRHTQTTLECLQILFFIHTY
jgi:hypothetical protein